MSPRHRALAGRPKPAIGTVVNDLAARAHRQRRRPVVARTIRARLAIILSVPTVLLVTLAVLGLIGQIRVSAQAAETVEQVELTLTTQDLIHSLQRERGLSSGLLGGAVNDRPRITEQRRSSDQARMTLDRLLAEPAAHDGTDGGGTDGGGTDGGGAGAVRVALGKLAELGAVRSAVDARRVSRQEMLDFYTTAINALNRAAAADDVGLSDPELRRWLEALTVLGEAKEATALERGHLNGVFAQGSFKRDDYLRLTEVRATKARALARFSRVAPPARAAALDSTLRTPAATEAATYEQRALAGARGERLNVSADLWWAAMTTVVDDMRQVQMGTGVDLRDRAEELRGQAMLQLAAYGAGAALTLLIALMLWLFTFRSIVHPLRDLADQANHAALHALPAAVARIQAVDPERDEPGATESGATEPGRDLADEAAGSVLPEPVRHHDELAEVADALGQLQRAAVELAVEQAVMRRNTAQSLASLGRRNQNLVRRQLRFISALEHDESDPNQLANLFELDHLATRIRRNAQSLLVLVGGQSPRRASRPVPVGNVLRSAFAEVEDYRRVTLRRADDTLIKGPAAPEVAHLLAELVENALACSPPDQQVEVQARGVGTEYHIAIVDQGIGMSAQAMKTANTRLHGEQSFLAAPTRDLGHYVVGRLADRHGIRTWLHDSPLNGVTARVVLPSSLLERPSPPQAEPGAGHGPATTPTDSGSDPRPRSSPAAGSRATAVPAEFRTADGRLTPTARRAEDSAAWFGGGPFGSVAPVRGVAPQGSEGAVGPAGPSGVPGPAAGTGAGGVPGATPSGLVKRQRGATMPTGRAVPPVTPSGPPRHGTASGPSRSPAEVRSMLNDFRSGVHRAEHDRSGEPD